MFCCQTGAQRKASPITGSEWTWASVCAGGEVGTPLGMIEISPRVPVWKPVSSTSWVVRFSRSSNPSARRAGPWSAGTVILRLAARAWTPAEVPQDQCSPVL
ncbi:hypothetical protein [Streptomyces massasporeus]|uniref:hypothetical protein n=1 Tax=Streptomyces massasporeus TaxID=67324 RepID=UPI0037F94DE2